MSPHLIPNEIVRALTAAIQHVLEAGEGTGGLPAARDVAQVLGLEGLDRALSVCRPGDRRAERPNNRHKAREYHRPPAVLLIKFVCPLQVAAPEKQGIFASIQRGTSLASDPVSDLISRNGAGHYRQQQQPKRNHTRR